MRRKTTGRRHGERGLGPAPRALKEMRERVRNTPGFPDLSQRQMAAEIGWKTSSYQWYEDNCAADYFDITKVLLFLGPLAKRGVPEGEVKRRLLGTAPVRVSFLPEGQGIDVPLLARNAAARIARGDVDLSNMSGTPREALRRMEAEGLIVAWQKVPDAGPDTVLFEIRDGEGSVIAVDTGDRVLAEGKSYVYCDTRGGGPEFVFATWQDGRMHDQEAGVEAPFDPATSYVVGRVIWLRIQKAM